MSLPGGLSVGALAHVWYTNAGAARAYPAWGKRLSRQQQPQVEVEDDTLLVPAFGVAQGEGG
jgi:hypothetical protein